MAVRPSFLEILNRRPSRRERLHEDIAPPELARLIGDPGAVRRERGVDGHWREHAAELGRSLRPVIENADSVNFESFITLKRRWSPFGDHDVGTCACSVFLPWSSAQPDCASRVAPSARCQKIREVALAIGLKRNPFAFSRPDGEAVASADGQTGESRTLRTGS